MLNLSQIKTKKAEGDKKESQTNDLNKEVKTNKECKECF